MMELIKDLRKYSGLSFRKDLIAGLTVAIILIPQGMAYADLAGLPPVYGLYGSLVPLFIYPLFASSRRLAIGPVALISIILYSSLSTIAPPDQYINFVLLTGLLSGIIQLCFAALRLGKLSNFLSKPVMSGFVSAAGIIIILSQLQGLLSLDFPRTASAFDNIKEIGTHISEANLFSLLIGMVSIGLLIGLKKLSRAIPGALIVVVISILLLANTGLNQEGIPVLGNLEKGLPPLTFDFLNWKNAMLVLPTAMILSLVCFIGSFSIAQSIQQDSDEHKVNGNKELLALGLAKILGSFTSALPPSGSFARSAVNNEAGVKTSMSNIFSGLIILGVLLFLGPLFYFLSYPVLSAIVIASVFSLIKWKYVIDLFRNDKLDFYVCIATFLATLYLGITNGVLAGIGLSLLAIIKRLSNPHVAILGALPGANAFRNIDRYPEAMQKEGVVILRYDQDLFFGNAGHFFQTIADIIDHENPNELILHIGSIHNIDSTAIERLISIIQYCKDRNVDILFTNVAGPIRDLFKRTGITDMLGEQSFYLSVKHAYDKNTAGNLACQSNI